MKPSILYLSYTGLLEPLGRSQVLAYLERLAREYEITLVTFEKPADLASGTAMDSMRAHCRRHGIRWLSRRYHRRPRLLATLYDLVSMIWLTLRHGRRGTALVHCRGYVTATAAWLAQRWTRVPFVFDMRALWLDEMQAAGRLRRGSVLARLLRGLERRLLRDAETVVSLTEAAVAHLHTCGSMPVDRATVVIPTCVDLTRFRVRSARFRTGDRLQLGSIGTITGGWFALDALVRLFAELRQTVAEARLQVTTRDATDELLARIETTDIAADEVDFRSCTPEQIPERIGEADVGFCVYAGDHAAHLGRMPTRIGEFLAAGVPVIGNRGVGDVATLIERGRVGVVLDSFDASGYRRAISQLLTLLHEPGIAARCRAVARERLSLDLGAERYRQLYQDIVDRNTAVVEPGAAR